MYIYIYLYYVTVISHLLEISVSHLPLKIPKSSGFAGLPHLEGCEVPQRPTALVGSRSFWWKKLVLPSGYLTVCHGKWPIYRWFTHL